MLGNYLIMAWRQIRKNKLYSAINILGLVVGLAVYLFGSMLVHYETTHDSFWRNSSRIYTVGSVFSPLANIGVSETDGVYSAFGPLIRADIPELEGVARTINRKFLVSLDDVHFYEKIRFVDPEFMTIFDFRFVEGDARALEDPSGLLLTESVARKFFGREPALGRVITLDHDVALHVTAVIRDLPGNTHFTSGFFGNNEFSMVAPLAALNKAADYDLAGNWNNLSGGDFTYMLVPERPGEVRDWLQAGLDGIYESHFDENQREFITGLKVRPLVEANTIIWDQVGMPILESVELLAFLVLVVAIVNYSNLATAQSLGRTREVGLRKTMGAGRRQLLVQFVVEGLFISVIAMLIALALLEFLIPVFNESAGKALHIDYVARLPWLLITTVLVGLVAGAYPAWVITRTSPIEALRNGGMKGIRGTFFRNLMLTLQFSISIFMLSIVLIMYFQNRKIEETSNIYPKSEIITLSRLYVESIRDRLDTLHHELVRIPGVENVSYSSQVPYLQNNNAFEAGATRGDKDSAFLINQIQIDENFLDTYDIRLLTGRGLRRDVSADVLKEGVLSLNVIINELAARKLGFSSPDAALGQVFYDFPEDREPRTFTVVGVSPDQNFLGFHNRIKPTVFMLDSDSFGYASIRVRGAKMNRVLTDIEAVWDRVIPDYPVQSEFLEETFDEVFTIYRSFNKVFGGLAFVALALSLIGLFGLAAFMAKARTREIGIRKVMGASLPQITRLLIWQFSMPVMWALLIALPLAWFASGLYLDFFADRVRMPVVIILLAGLLAVLIAWLIVSFHALRIARANPVHALRYE